MATLTTARMNNVRVGTPTARLTGRTVFKQRKSGCAARAPDRSPSSPPLQYGNITADAVYHYFDNLLPDSPQVRDRIVRRWSGALEAAVRSAGRSRGRDSVGAVTLLPPGKRRTEGLRWQTLDEAQLTALLTAYQSDIPLGMITSRRFPYLGGRRPGENGAAADGRAVVDVFRRAPRRPRISLSRPSADQAAQCDAGSA